MSKILVDTSVWINYFKSESKHTSLNKLILDDLICTNPIIRCELIPSLIHHKESELLDIFNCIKMITINQDWDSYRNYQVVNLKNGINGVGLVDIMILHNVMENNLILYTCDKHFKMMSEIFNFLFFEE